MRRTSPIAAPGSGPRPVPAQALRPLLPAAELSGERAQGGRALLVALPDLEVAPGRDHRERPVAHLGVQPSGLELRRRQAGPELRRRRLVAELELLPYPRRQRGRVLAAADALQPLVAHVGGQVVLEDPGPPGAHRRASVTRFPQRAGG